jgi:hypothetical protein
MEAVDACLAPDQTSASTVTTLSGHIAAVTAQAPFLGPPTTMRLRRVPCEPRR